MNIFSRKLNLQKVQTLHSSYNTRTILQFANYFSYQQPYLLFVMIYFKALIFWVDIISLNLYSDTYLFTFDTLSFWSYIFLICQ